jgi:hypothetical protein
MTIVSQVIRRGHSGTTPRWLELSQSQVRKIKADEEEASEKRMMQFKEIDRRRNEAYTAHHEARTQRDKNILIGAIIAIAVVLVIIILVVLM